jgi:hypothetical protein
MQPGTGLLWQGHLVLLLQLPLRWMGLRPRCAPLCSRCLEGLLVLGCLLLQLPLRRLQLGLYCRLLGSCRLQCLPMGRQLPLQLLLHALEVCTIPRQLLPHALEPLRHG